jgi:hypothetical protein
MCGSVATWQEPSTVGRCTATVMMPRRAVLMTVGLLAAVLVLLAGCDGSRPTTRPTAAAPSTTAIRPPQPVTLADARRCPVTRPNGAAPPRVGAQAGVNHGNTKLWTALWPGGVIRAEPDYVDKDGSIHMKFGWWRGVSGRLSIQGRRLDGQAPPLRAEVSDGYGDRGFQASGVIFPTEGCWEITGQVGTARLTFVNFVIKV